MIRQEGGKGGREISGFSFWVLVGRISNKFLKTQTLVSPPPMNYSRSLWKEMCCFSEEREDRVGGASTISSFGFSVSFAVFLSIWPKLNFTYTFTPDIQYRLKVSPIWGHVHTVEVGTSRGVRASLGVSRVKSRGSQPEFCTYIIIIVTKQVEYHHRP